MNDIGNNQAVNPSIPHLTGRSLLGLGKPRLLNGPIPSNQFWTWVNPTFNRTSDKKGLLTLELEIKMEPLSDPHEILLNRGPYKYLKMFD
jgi:hypothetical protein